jgi:hypothetical protein
MKNEENIRKLNDLLKSDSEASKVGSEQVGQYFDEFRQLFRNFAHIFKTTVTDNERKELFREMCELNYLYAIQLKLGHDLPKDLYEVAYDFDNPDYPGYNQVAQKISNNSYLLLKEHVG